MKQTAVEWLVKIYLQTNKIDSFDIEQAKEMEKQHIKHAWDNGAYGGGQFMQIIDDAEQYYNETYGSKESDENQAYCGIIDCKCTTSSQTEISDEEIKKAAHEHGYEHHSFFTAATSNQKKLSWIAACKWYREQLKKKQ